MATVYDSQYHETRAFVDVGSGNTKLAIATVDKRSNMIVKRIFDKKYPLAFQKALELSSKKEFNVEIQGKAEQVFNEIHTHCKTHQVQRTVAVATHAFRVAINGKQVASNLKIRTKVPVRVIPQREEGAIGYSSVKKVQSVAKKIFGVLEIGTGSFQLSLSEKPLEENVFYGSYGAVPFNQLVLSQSLERGKSDHVYSMTKLQKDHAIQLARNIAKKASPKVKDKIKTLNGKIHGLGGFFVKSLLPNCKDGKITKENLEAFINKSYAKTYDQLNNPFADTNLTNAILALGFMQELKINEILPIDTDNTGFSHDSYWKENTWYENLAQWFSDLIAYLFNCVS